MQIERKQMPASHPPAAVVLPHAVHHFEVVRKRDIGRHVAAVRAADGFLALQRLSL
jgi:hypothetical protein